MEPFVVRVPNRLASRGGRSLNSCVIISRIRSTPALCRRIIDYRPRKIERITLRSKINYVCIN